MGKQKPKPFISVIIAALNEEAAIANVIKSVPKDLADEIVVVDNGSKDQTAHIARLAGARVVKEPIPGYGRAFRTGLRSISPMCEIVVFLDGDGSDCPEMMGRLVTPIMEGTSDFVIGSRTRGNRETGSMNFHQVLAGYMIGFLLRVLYGVRSTDMGPFRAIRRETFRYNANSIRNTANWRPVSRCCRSTLRTASSAISGTTPTPAPSKS